MRICPFALGALGALTLLTVAASPWAAAQAPADVAFPHPRHVLFDESPDGSLWAAGPGYKASAAPGGFQFVPFRGSDAPMNEPLGFAPQRASIGDVELGFEGDGTVVRLDGAIAIQRGPLDERLRCSPEGVELIVEVQVPVDAGAVLEVEYRCNGGYAIEPAPGGGLLFRGTLGDVSMGAAVAVEPDGRRTPVALEPTEGGFTFVVPAETVARSRGRVVIDPLITGGVISSNPTREDLSVDVGADASQGFLVAIERAFSATDSDVFVYQVPTSGSVAGTFVATIDFTTTNWAEPSLCVRRALGDFIVAATRGSGSSVEVWCRWLTTSGSAIAAPFFALPGERPDICVETNANGLTPRWYVIAVDEGTLPSSLTRRIVTGSGSTVGTTGPIYRFNSSRDISHAAIGEVSGPPGPPGSPDPTRFNVVVSERDGFGDVLRLLSFSRSSLLVSTTNLATVDRVQSLAVGSLGPDNLGPFFGTFAVAYEAQPVFFGESEVHVIACNQSGAQGDPVAMGELMNMNRDAPRRNPSVASDGERWTLTFEEETASFLPTRVVAVEGSYAGGQFGLTMRRAQLSNAFSASGAPSSCALWAGGGFASAGRRVLTAYVGGGATRGALSEPVEPRAAGVQYCEAAGNSAGSSGAWLSARGSTDATTSKILRLEQAPPGQFSLLLVASSTNFVPGIGGSAGNLCLGPDEFGRYNAELGLINVNGIRATFISPSQIPQALGTTAAQVGESWYFQAWFRDVEQGVFTSNLSNGVRIRFDH